MVGQWTLLGQKVFLVREPKHDSDLPLQDTGLGVFQDRNMLPSYPSPLSRGGRLGPFWTPQSWFLDSLLSEERVLEPTVLAPNWLLTVGHHCTAPWQTGRPAHWLPLRKAAPAPPGILALRGSCCGQWMKSHRVRTRCQRRKGACRSLKRGGEIVTFPRNPAILSRRCGPLGLSGQQASSA